MRKLLGIQWSLARAIHLSVFVVLIGLAVAFKSYSSILLIVGLMATVAWRYRT
jgi:hypothetical protein